MARNKRSRLRRSAIARRIANAKAPALLRSEDRGRTRFVLSPTVRRLLSAVPPSAVEDRRTFSPSSVFVPRDLMGRPAAVVYVRRKTVRGVRSRSTFKRAFLHSEFVVECAKRGRRREVLHALRKTGRGSGGGRKRRGPLSDVRC